LSIPGEILISLFTAAGVVLGGAMIGSIGSLLAGESPFAGMRHLAGSVRLWAVVVAMGGTFSAIQALESGIYFGRLHILLRQILVIISAFCGAQLGHWLIKEITGGV